MEAIDETVRPTRGEAIVKVLGFAAVLGATIFVIWQLRPGLLFSSNMDVGGDNAGHVVTPYFLIHDLLPQGRITGWDPQWFEGFPLYVFDFPLPALFVAAFWSRSLMRLPSSCHTPRSWSPSQCRLGPSGDWQASGGRYRH